MLSYCLRCIKITESKTPEVSTNENEKIMLLSRCAVCGSKKLKLVTEQETSGLLNQIGVGTPLIF